MKDRVNDPRSLWRAWAALAVTVTFPAPTAVLAATKAPVAITAPKPTYARLADLVIASPAIAVLTVKKIAVLPPDRAPGLGAGMQRFIVTADTQSLIRSNDVLARQATFLIDLPGATKSKHTKWKARRFIVFGRVEDRVDFFQLLSSNALIAWSPDNETLVRKVVSEMTARDVPPLIRGVDSVFHVTGAVAGEGETQIFLTTGDGSPISLSIIRKPDEKPQFGVSLGEIVDEAAAMPAADTPLWYRLSCSLPARLPAPALSGQSSAEGRAATQDYEAFISALAPCDRGPTPID